MRSGLGTMPVNARDVLTRAFDLASSPVVYPLIERLADARIPESLRVPLYGTLARIWEIDLGEFEGPLERYPTLGAFFVRRVVEGARPVDPDPEAVVSPADGELQGTVSFGPGSDPVVEVKGARVPLGRLLGAYAPAIADGGHAFVVYLSPRDGHRVHLPVEGRVLSWQAVAGARLPVNRLGVLLRPDVLACNERAILDIEPTRGGRFFLVLVAAYGVARTSLRFAPADDVRRRSGGPPTILIDRQVLARGTEIGAFNLGSTVVAIWPAAAGPVEWAGRVGPIRVGERVARWPARHAA